MTKTGLRPLWMAILLGTAVTSGLPGTAQASVVLLDQKFQDGTLVSMEEITNVTGIDMTKIVGLTACDPKALYAVERHVGPLSVTSYALWFSNDSGQSWTKQGRLGKGREIACDHAQLATLDNARQLWVAPLISNGEVGVWAAAPTTVRVDRIQGGDGSIYGVKIVASGRDVYVASAKAASVPLDWGSPIVNIGATQVTGTGLTRTGTDNLTVPNTPAWSRRAFGLEANGTVITNAKLLEGNNGWGSLDTRNERYTTLSAAAPNILFGIQNKNGVNHLGRIRITETACADGLDNDANGLTDSWDPKCTLWAANVFCATKGDGTYCSDRFQPAFFLGQPNQNALMVRCTNHVATIKRGVCVRTPGAPNQDRLKSLDELTPPDPPDTARYCNVHWPDGTWGFNWTGVTPCRPLLNSKPDGKVVRAGLYSTTGPNHAFAACDNGSFGPVGANGSAPLQTVNDAVGHTANRCIISVSAGALPIFDQMFKAAHNLPLPRTTNPFVHNQSPVDLAQFGHGETGTSLGVDRFGRNFGDWEAAYDHPINEGRELYAVSGGVVLENGSRDRDVTGVGCGGTPNQGELYVQYSVGTNPVYRETFVVYYAHVRKRFVEDEQTVKAGQIIGYVGSTGCTGGFGHLHSGVMRTTNTNAHTTAAPEFGYQMTLLTTTGLTGTNFGGDISIDPLGWANFSAFDPWAYTEWNTDTGNGFFGKGAWSINLFKDGQQFAYPSR